jgi:trehalose 6-phosphate phosphatase
MEGSDSQILQDFWTRLKRADQKVLLLDYDGTLAPFQQERDKAFPYPGVRDILQKIQDSGNSRLIIISGRAIADLLPLLNLSAPPELWGSHGYERRLVDGTLSTPELDTNCLLNLDKAFNWAEEHGYSHACEKKPSSVAFHWRGSANNRKPQLEEEVRRAWTPFILEDKLAIHSFDGGLELRCEGFNKGEAVKQILAESGRNFAMAYLGDDLTDEDGFRALKGKGLSILVRKTYRDTLADCWLKPPDGLLNFLRNWIVYTTG